MTGHPTLTDFFARVRDPPRWCRSNHRSSPGSCLPRCRASARGLPTRSGSLARELRRWFEQPREVSLKHELAALRFRPIAQDRYRARLEAIDAFADRVDFDLYGEGWQVRHKGVSPRLHARALRAYRGPVQDKLHVLAGYRFALAIENTRFAGY